MHIASNLYGHFSVMKLYKCLGEYEGINELAVVLRETYIKAFMASMTNADEKRGFFL